MNSLIDIEIISSSNFDYSKLDNDTSDELQKIATEISAINSNIKYLIGEELTKAQSLLAKKGYGCFVEWIESYGLKRQLAYNCINYYQVFFHNVDKQDKLKQLPFSKVHELGRLEAEQQKEILEKVNLQDMSIQEVKNLTKQLKSEKEYSEELQESIKEKEKQISELKEEMNNIQIPKKEIVEKEVIKEVVPENLILEKESLEKELDTLRKRAEKAEDTIKSIKLEDNIEKDKVFDTAKLDMLLFNIRDFLDKNSKFTYLKEELQNIPTKKKRFIQQSVNSIKEWSMLMEQALDNRQDVVGNIIYGEGEIIDE